MHWLHWILGHQPVHHPLYLVQHHPPLSCIPRTSISPTPSLYHSRSKLFWGGMADTAEGSVPPSTKVGMQTIQVSI